ncbi:MAG: hypothetical protein B5M52_07715 [Helicobacteraceae bacterium 4484_230]|nr:MAG: hypothetical protein B5M52_07715 [Helicobacteraceae bacterium 4484_230]
MTLDTACTECIINQSRRVADAIHADAELSRLLTGTVMRMSKVFDPKDSPPEAASDVYEKMAELAGKKDLYDEVKRHSSDKAKAFMPELRLRIDNSQDRLLTAVKVAIAGNVIDLAAEVSFDLDEELEKIFDTEFDYNDLEKLRTLLASSSTLLYIGDNVGEHLFDYLTIETLQKLYPKLHISYMVRGNPIINDVTMKEAKEAGFDKLCDLVDSGVNTPGFVYGRANAHSQKLFDEADIVITKGMGNYECLSPSPRKSLAYLLKVKCNVVARSLGMEVGDIVCKLV